MKPLPSHARNTNRRPQMRFRGDRYAIGTHHTMSYSTLRSAHAFSLAVLLLSAVAPLRADDDASVAPNEEPPAPAIALPRTATLDPIGLRFTYPADFAEGRYKPDPDPIAWLLNNALVLVEAADVDPAELDKLSPGKYATISIHPLKRGVEAEFFTPHLRPERKCLIGEKLVYKLPGYPGPFGKHLHCYVLPFPDGSAVLFIASSRFQDGGETWPTHYDWVIERIIATATFDNAVAHATAAE